MLAAEGYAMRLWACSNYNGTQQQNGGGEHCQGLPVGIAMAQQRFEVRRGGADKDTNLISEAGEKSAEPVWGEFVEMRGNYAPSALHHELH